MEHEISFGEALARTLVSSIVFIVLGLVYFMITLWIVKTGSSLLGYQPGADWAVLSAALIACGSMIGSALK